MRLYTKYKVLQPARKAGRGFYWSLTAIGLMFLIWIWLNAGELTYSPPRDDPARPELNPIWERARSNQFPARPLADAPAPVVLPELPPPPAPIRPEVVPQESIYSTKTFAPRPVESVLEAQIVMTRLGISCGAIDGVIGPQTRGALRVYQRQMRLPETGNLDADTKASLVLQAPPLRFYAISSNDFARLHPPGQQVAAKPRPTRTESETVLEMVAEKFSTSPNLLRRLNSAINWTNVAPGTVIQVPNLERPPRARSVLLRSPVENGGAV
jgi:hypothetical protein